MDKYQIIDNLIDRCNKFHEDISEISIWNLNYETPKPEIIDKGSANWRMFIDDINCLDSKIGDYEGIDELKLYISRLSTVDGNVIDDILVQLNKIKNSCQINSVQIKDNTTCSKLERLLLEMNDLESHFVINPLFNVPTICNDAKFIEWRSELKFELENNYKEYASDILEKLDQFKGWRDKSLFQNIKADLQVLCKNVVRKESKIGMKKVFVVHGHDDAAKETVARTLEKLGLEAVILHERPNEGKTIIEKIEKYSDVDYAVVLYTPCDVGHGVKETVEKKRARQNVVFEHGYLIAKLGRENVSALLKGDVEKPGDIDGVIYILMDEGGSWKFELVTNMQSVGLNVDANDLLPKRRSS